MYTRQTPGSQIEGAAEWKPGLGCSVRLGKALSPLFGTPEALYARCFLAGSKEMPEGPKRPQRLKQLKRKQEWTFIFCAACATAQPQARSVGCGEGAASGGAPTSGIGLEPGKQAAQLLCQGGRLSICWCAQQLQGDIAGRRVCEK